MNKGHAPLYPSFMAKPPEVAPHDENGGRKVETSARRYERNVCSVVPPLINYSRLRLYEEGGLHYRANESIVSCRVASPPLQAQTVGEHGECAAISTAAGWTFKAGDF